jgi:hypothetical protein
VPFAVGFVLRSGRRHLVQRHRPDLELPRPPLREESNSGESALVYPVAHRTRIRVAVVLGRRPPSPGRTTSRAVGKPSFAAG